VYRLLDKKNKTRTGQKLCNGVWIYVMVNRRSDLNFSTI